MQSGPFFQGPCADLKGCLRPARSALRQQTTRAFAIADQPHQLAFFKRSDRSQTFSPMSV
eukprot:4410052-Amphidinium_carterae.1